MKKMFKNALLATIGMMLVNLSNAQVATFEKVIHDYGTISESEGDITYEFTVKNTGDKPLIIQRVNASCGCTTSGWTTEPIAPGASGFVKATYGAKGRIGAFDKSLTVFSNGTVPSITLRVKGLVTAKPVDLRADYPQNIGLLRVKELKDILLSPSKGVEQVLEIANAETSNVLVSVENVPDHLIVTAEPTSLNPNQKGVIRFKINSAKAKTYGFKSGSVTVKVGDVKKTIKVDAAIAQDFSSLRSADIVVAPRVEIQSTTIDLGTVKKGVSFSKVIDLKNAGQSELIVSGFTTADKTFAPVSKPVRAKEGKTASLKITGKADTVGNKTIVAYIVTNAPGTPLLEVSLLLKVE